MTHVTRRGDNDSSRACPYSCGVLIPSSCHICHRAGVEALACVHLFGKKPAGKPTEIVPQVVV